MSLPGRLLPVPGRTGWSYGLPMLGRAARFLALVFISLGIVLPTLGVEAGGSDALEREFTASVRPLMQEYCLACHSTEKHKGDLDLEQYGSLQDVLRQPKSWEQVVEQVTLGEMPPKGKPGPSAAERQHFLDWINRTLETAAMAHAGDPGPVPLRRLNNAEYTYTIRDLTGIESLAPAMTFPADSAAGEGFMNTGASLVMSPALLSKYLDAGKEIATHAVLLPDGFRFSEKTSRRDWTEEVLAQIRQLYRRYTDPRGAEKVNLQGIVFETNEGGRLPLEAYLQATLEWRVRIAEGAAPSDGLQQIAAQRGLSPKYLRSLWEVLNANDPSLLLDGIRARWRESKPGEAAAVAERIGLWQKALWKFSSVGHIGKLGGPKAWMEPVSPLREKQEFQLKLAATTNEHSITVYLAASGAGDGASGDVVVWQQPRLVLPGKSPLALRDAREFIRAAASQAARALSADADDWALAPERFGVAPDGSAIESSNLCVQAPSIIEIKLPAELVSGGEFVTTGSLHPQLGAEGSVQLQVSLTRPEAGLGLTPGQSRVAPAHGPWTSSPPRVSNDLPIILQPSSAARRRIEASCEQFRNWFPAALCYQKIVPVDEVITLILFHREDEPLCRLMLEDAERVRLDRLWDELRYISRDAITLVDAFDQLWQYATQDADPKVFEPLRQPIRDRAAALQQRLRDTQPRQVDALLQFAARAYRHPLSPDEASQLRALYAKLRGEELSHEEAFQLTLARIFVAPSFLYRLEKAAPGKDSAPVSDWELASRLSYFLWSSSPDEELTRHAAAGALHDPEVLVTQARRMMTDGKVRRLAVEFGSAWLHLYDFRELNEKSERHFPTFAELREPMMEEAVRYLTEIFQKNGSVLDLFDSDYTMLNDALAKEYGIPGVTGPAWRRVDGVRAFGRGGVLGLGATLAKQSGASRTSPILRGNWVAEVLLGDKLPRPPKDVPQLPEDESSEALTVRQLVEKHSSDPRCATCHTRIDGYGFALEGYDAIGRARAQDLAGRPLDTRAKLFDGTMVDGALGLREYLLNQKRDILLRQFCRKLLGYALGRGVLLSDKPLLDEMLVQLRQREFRFSAAVETILRSRQFQQVRGQQMADDGSVDQTLRKASL